MLVLPLRSTALDPAVPDVDNRCKLLGPTALVVQALMGVLVLASLLYKRHREVPRRPWKIWVFDVSKQVVGQAMLHSSNVIISSFFKRGSGSSNPCVSYFLNILLDTTLGILLIYSFLYIFTSILTNSFHLNGFQSGVYGDPPKPTYWLRQAVVYVTTLILMKLCVLALLYLIPWLYTAADWLLSWTGNRNSVQVIFVMGIFPIAMNILQFWLIDSIVKFKTKLIPSRSSTPQDEEPLINGDVDDNQDEGISSFDVDIEPGRRHKSSTISREGSPFSPKRRPAPLSSSSHRDSIISSSSSTPTVTNLNAHTVFHRSPPPSPSHSSTPSSTPSYGSINRSTQRPSQTWGWSHDVADGNNEGQAREEWNMPRVVSPSNENRR